MLQSRLPSRTQQRNTLLRTRESRISCRCSVTFIGLGAATAATAAECIAPANPGGGWDFTCRQIGKILYDIGEVDSPVQVTNMAGAGGGLAFSTVVNERGDDADVGNQTADGQSPEGEECTLHAAFGNERECERDRGREGGGVDRELKPKTLIIDASEQPIERPVKRQQNYYSGKKKTYDQSSAHHLRG